MQLQHERLHDILKRREHVKLEFIFSKILLNLTDLADETVLIDEVSNTALNNGVPGGPGLAIRELERQAVEVIIPVKRYINIGHHTERWKLYGKKNTWKES